MKIKSLMKVAEGNLKEMKEKIAVEKLMKMNEEIRKMEAALEVLTTKRDEFMEMEIEDVPLQEFTY